MLPYNRCQILLESEIESEHLGNGEKCFVFGEQQVKCLACIHFSLLQLSSSAKNSPKHQQPACFYGFRLP